MTLSDNVIAHVAQLVQIAILTGTDVVDHMVLVDNEGTLELDEEYEQRSEENVQRMIREAVAMQGENAE